MAAETRVSTTQDDRWAVPCCGRGPADPPSASPTARPAPPRRRLLRRAALRRSPSWSWCRSLLGLLVTDVLARRVGGLGRAADNGAIRELVKERSGFLDTTLGGRVDRRRRARAADPRRPRSRSCARSCAAGGSPPSRCSCSSIESATYRVTSLVVPRQRPDVARLEDLPGERELPVRPHRRVDRRLRRPRVPARHPASGNRARPRHRAWAAAIVLPVFVAMSRMYRGMHHPLGRRRRRAHRRRRDDGAAVRVPRGGRRRPRSGPREPHRRAQTPSRSRRDRVQAAREGRGRRPRREDARRRPAGAAPRPRRPRASRTRCGTRCPRRRRRPSRSAAPSTRARTSSSRGAATGRCAAASASSPARDACLAVIPAGTANLFATNLGHPEGHRAGGRDRAAAARAGATTSAASPASASG